MTAEVLFKKPYRSDADKAWYHRRVIKGLYEVTQGGSIETGLEIVVRAVDDDKHPVTQPVLLDTDGYRLADGAEPAIAETQLYGLIAYSGMGLF